MTWNDLRLLAESQRGLFSAAQAAQLGITPLWLSRAARSGRLRRSRRGVYAIAGTPPSRWEAMISAALAAGPSAVISHASAASAHGLHFCRPAPATLELTVPAGSYRQIGGVTLHRRQPLPKEDIITKHGVLVTSPARTLVDMAGRLKAPLLERTLDEGIIEHLWAPSDVAQALERAPLNSSARRVLGRLLDLRLEGPNADSVLERRAFAALAVLPPFTIHFVVRVREMTYVIDAAWPLLKIGAEVVGRSHRKASRSAFDRERRKLNMLAADGWLIAHLTAAMSGPEMVDEVYRLIASRQSSR